MNNSWLLLVLLAQVIGAVVVLFDKYLVAKVISSPSVYAFYVSFLSLPVLIILPFTNITWPTVPVIELSLLSAVTFVASIIFLYEALAISDASDVMPVAGGLAALASLFFSLFILKNNLPSNFMVGFVFLIVGTFLTSHFRLSGRSFIYILISGIAAGLSTVIIKDMFGLVSFMEGFFWSRMANVFIALILLLVPSVRRGIASDVGRPESGKHTIMILFNKTLAGISLILILVAINLGNVSLVNALAGLQFLLILLFVWLFANRIPGYIPEKVSSQSIIHKVSAIVCIVLGYFLLFR